MVVELSELRSTWCGRITTLPDRKEMEGQNTHLILGKAERPCQCERLKFFRTALKELLLEKGLGKLVCPEIPEILHPFPYSYVPNRELQLL